MSDEAPPPEEEAAPPEEEAPPPEEPEAPPLAEEDAPPPEEEAVPPPADPQFEEEVIPPEDGGTRGFEGGADAGSATEVGETSGCERFCDSLAGVVIGLFLFFVAGRLPASRLREAVGSGGPLDCLRRPPCKFALT